MDEATPRYELVRLARTSARGEVWEGVLRGPRGFLKPVSVERPCESLPADAALRWAKAGAAVDHPNVLAVLEPVQLDGAWCLATEAFAGRPVSGSAPVAPATLLDLAIQASRGLAAVHQAAQVHGAITGDDVLVDARGWVKLAGVGRAAGGSRAGDLAALASVIASVPRERPTPLLDAAIARCLGPDADAAALARSLAALREADPGTFEDASTHGARGRLPIPPDPFVGRDAEVADLAGRLAGDARLVTLVGPGGIGKTRLALEVAQRCEFPGGTWFCDVAEARSVAALCAAVRGALEVDASPRDPIEHLARVLEGRPRLLLVLDNLEQVVDAVGPVVGRWLEAAPGLVVLATSRIALRLANEEVVGVRPLSEADAVALFSARSARAPGPGDAERVRDIARHMDGLPLALELVAARTKLLGVGGVWSRMRDRYRLASGGGPERPARHRSLSASMDFSWELLTPTERAALARATVFVGRFDADAALAVLDVGAVQEALDELVAHGLLTFDPVAARYAMPAVVTEYAREQLMPQAERDAVERHGAWFARLGTADAVRHQNGPEGYRRRGVVLRSADNLMAAVDRAIARGDAAVAASCVLAATQVLTSTGQTEWILRAIGAVRALDPSLRPGELDLAEGRSLRQLGLRVEAVERFECAVVTFAASGDRVHEGLARLQLAITLHQIGEVEGAGSALDGALECARSAGDPATVVGALSLRVSLLGGGGELERARELALETLRAAEELGDDDLVILTHNKLGVLALLVGRLDQAHGALSEALRLRGARTGSLTGAAERHNLAILECTRGRFDEARRWVEGCIACARLFGDRVGVSNAEALLGRIHFEQGAIDLAEPLLRTAQAALLQNRDPRRVAALATLARLELGRGRVEAAEGWLAACDEAGRPETSAVADVLAARVQVEVAAGRGDEAVAALRQLEALVASLGALPEAPAGRWLALARAAVVGADG